MINQFNTRLSERDAARAAGYSVCGCGGSEYVDEARLLPGGDLDRAEVVEPDPKRVAAASASFKVRSLVCWDTGGAM